MIRLLFPVISLVLLGLMLACGGGGPTGPAVFPDEALVVESGWDALPFQPNKSPLPTTPLQGEKVGDVLALLARSHPDETFVVTRLRGSTRAVLGYGGGAGGEFLAMPAGRPAEMFGGHVRMKRHNFDCARAMAPLVAWAEQAFSDEAFRLSHGCLASDEAEPVPLFEVLDGSGWPAEAVLDVWEDRIALALDRFVVQDAPIVQAHLHVVMHPNGSTAALRLLGLGRREDRERYALGEASSSWKKGDTVSPSSDPSSVSAETPRAARLDDPSLSAAGWTRDSARSFERAERIESVVDATIRPLAPDAVRFEVFRRGNPEDTIEGIANQPSKRQAVTVRAWVNEPVSAQVLADWTLAAQRAVDPRLLLYMEVTVCEAEVTHPWSDPDLCTRGWDDWTVFTVGDRRRRLDRPAQAPGVGR